MRSLHLTFVARAVAVAVALLSCPVLRAADNKLVLTGSSTVAPLAAEIGKRFEERHPPSTAKTFTARMSKCRRCVAASA